MVSARKGRPSAELTYARRRAVVEAAKSEFLEKGYRMATMDGIASRAGVSKRSLYLWHKDKAALFDACVVEGTAEMQLPQLGSRLQPAAALTAYGAVILPALSTDHSLQMTRLLYRESSDFEEVRKALTHGSALICRPITEYLAGRGHGTGEAAEIAEMFVAALLAPIQRAVLDSKPAPDITASIRHMGTAVSIFAAGIEQLEMDRANAVTVASSVAA